MNLYSAGELLLLAGLAAQTARLLYAIVTPVGPLGDWRPAQLVIPVDPAALLASFDPFFRVSGAGGSGPAVVTSLPLKLFGIRLNEATARGSAIIAGPDGLQRSVDVGEEIVPGVTLKAVAFDHVTVSRGGGNITGHQVAAAAAARLRICSSTSRAQPRRLRRSLSREARPRRSPVLRLPLRRPPRR